MQGRVKRIMRKHSKEFAVPKYLNYIEAHSLLLEGMLTYYCPNCKERFSVDTSALESGNQIKCLKCKNFIAVDKVDYAFG